MTNVNPNVAVGVNSFIRSNSDSKPMTQAKIKKAVDDYAANRHNDDLKRILTDLGDGVYTGTTHRVTVSTWIPLRFDVAAFKAQHPDLYAKFLLQDEPVQFARINHR